MWIELAKDQAWIHKYVTQQLRCFSINSIAEAHSAEFRTSHCKLRTCLLFPLAHVRSPRKTKQKHLVFVFSSEMC
jgi:hypothetical protein